MEGQRDTNEAISVPMHSLALVSGTVVDDRYRLEAKLGSGGMGEVWKARDQRLFSAVAIKILRLAAELPEDTEERFEREMRVMNTMVTPQVVPILDRGLFNGRMYLVMTYLEGEDMESALTETHHMHWSEVLRILSSIAEVLQEAHARGLLHRDLKPANIFLQSIPGRTESVVRVLDFGVAKTLSTASINVQGARELTQLGSVVGTPKYMAPEQFSGEAQVASDLYSLGVVAFHAISGDVPFPGPTLPQIAFQHCSAPVPPLPKFVPAEVTQLIHDLLVKDPTKRLPTAAALRTRIDSIFAMRGASGVISAADLNDAAMRASSLSGAMARRSSSGEEDLKSVVNVNGLQAGLRAPSVVRTTWKMGAQHEEPVTVMTEASVPAPRFDQSVRRQGEVFGNSNRVDGTSTLPGMSKLQLLIYEYRPHLVVLSRIGLVLAASLLMGLIWMMLQGDPEVLVIQPVTTPNPTPAEPIREDAPPGMVSVPAGAFLMGCDHTYDPECTSREPELSSVDVEAFYIDQTEVSVGDYARCIAAGGCDDNGLTVPFSGGKEHEDRSKWCNWSHQNKDEHPINCITWEQARQYCEWAGKRLPTEREWEKASRGTDGHMYPWGDGPPNCRWVVMSDGGNGCGQGWTWPVFSMKDGESPYGARHMAGNVAEWVVDPLAPNRPHIHVYRGGSWGSDETKELRVYHREAARAAVRLNTVGMRCARSLSYSSQ